MTYGMCCFHGFGCTDMSLSSGFCGSWFIALRPDAVTLLGLWFVNALGTHLVSSSDAMDKQNRDAQDPGIRGVLAMSLRAMSGLADAVQASLASV
jgi:hypothetical protein